VLRPGENDRCTCGEEWVNATIVVDHAGRVVACTRDAACSSCGRVRVLPQEVARQSARWCKHPTPSKSRKPLREDVCVNCGWLIVDHNPLRLLQMAWKARAR